MKPREFVALNTVDREQITVGTRYVMRIEPEAGNRARIFVEGRESFVVEMSYGYAVQQICGIR